MAGLSWEPNMGQGDRYVRIAVGGLLLAASSARMARSGMLAGCGWGLLGGTMLAEGVLGTCPVYPLLGIDTRDSAGAGSLNPYEGI